MNQCSSDLNTLQIAVLAMAPTGSVAEAVVALKASQQAISNKQNIREIQISDQCLTNHDFRGFFNIYIYIFNKFGILGWIRNGEVITNPFVNCEISL